MGVDFEAEGLLDGLEDEAARTARLALLEQLAADGVPLEELKRAVAEDRLAVLPVERVLAGDGERYTTAEVAERSGLDEALLLRYRRALGLSLPAPGERAFSDADVEAAAQVREFVRAGMPEEQMLEVTRVLGQAMAQFAGAVQLAFGDAFLQAGDTERDVALRYAEAAAQLSPALTPLLEYVYDVHQREALRQAVIAREELESGRLAGGRRISACFADLVGFTRLGESVAPDALGDVAGRLGEMASDVASPPVRLVKLIGDAAMLVAPQGEPLLSAALALVDAADAEGPGFPQLRAGIAAGEALERGGDWYGRPVNLASRITSVARPGSVLATADVREEVGEGYSWSRVGRRRLRGVRGEVLLFRARHVEA